MMLIKVRRGELLPRQSGNSGVGVECRDQRSGESQFRYPVRSPGMPLGGGSYCSDVSREPAMSQQPHVVGRFGYSRVTHSPFRDEIRFAVVASRRSGL